MAEFRKYTFFIKCIHLIKDVGRWEYPSGEETTAKSHFPRAMTRSSVSKNRVTPSVAAPGDTNPTIVTPLVVGAKNGKTKQNR